MAKSISFSDSDYLQIVEAAEKCGFRVSRGRGSQLGQFVVMASNKACSGRGGMRPRKSGLYYVEFREDGTLQLTPRR
jgi:hypothetical protein